MEICSINKGGNNTIVLTVHHKNVCLKNWYSLKIPNICTIFFEVTEIEKTKYGYYSTLKSEQMEEENVSWGWDKVDILFNSSIFQHSLELVTNVTVLTKLRYKSRLKPQHTPENTIDNFLSEVQRLCWEYGVEIWPKGINESNPDGSRPTFCVYLKSKKTGEVAEKRALLYLDGDSSTTPVNTTCFVFMTKQEAKERFLQNREVYIIHNDGSESLVKFIQDINNYNVFAKEVEIHNPLKKD